MGQWVITYPRTLVCLLSVAETSQTSPAFSQPRHYASVLIPLRKYRDSNPYRWKNPITFDFFSTFPQLLATDLLHKEYEYVLPPTTITKGQLALI